MTSPVENDALDLIDSIKTNLDQANAMATLAADDMNLGFSKWNDKIQHDYLCALADKIQGLAESFAALEVLRGKGEIPISKPSSQ